MRSSAVYVHTRLDRSARALLAAGVKVPPIGHPEYASAGEICIADPDGYLVLVAHWGKPEQEAWD